MEVSGQLHAPAALTPDVELGRIYVLKPSRAISHVDVTPTLMPGMEGDLRNVGSNSTSTLLIAREDFSTFISRERFKCYIGRI
jgi:hypothetical protein